MLDGVESERPGDADDRRYARRSGGTPPRLAALVCCTALLAVPASALAQADCAAAPGGWPPGDWTVGCTRDVIAGLDQTDNLVEGGLWSDQVCSASTAGTPAEIAWKKRRGLTSRGETSYFDDPLHRPRNRDHAYRTSIFWLWLGRRFSSPSEIAYLHEMFEVGDFVAGYGLEDFDTFLFRRDTSLYEIFPAFIAERVTRPVMYADGNRSVSIRYSEPKAEETHRGSVAVLAAEPVTVNVEVPTDTNTIRSIASFSLSLGDCYDKRG